MKYSFLFIFGLSLHSYGSTPLAHPTVQIEPHSVTLSGISSGAYMSVQMGFIYSDLIKGVGAVSGGVFACAEGNEIKAIKTCMKQPQSIDVPHTVELLQKEEKTEKISPLENLKSQRVYLLGSPKDTVNLIQGTYKLKELYTNWVPPQNIKIESQIEAGHGFPTLKYGIACDKEEAPWLNNCNYDTAGEILKQMYPDVKTSGNSRGQNVFRISQPQKTGNSATHLLEVGAIYIPTDCQNGQTQCRLHVALHGCRQSAEMVDYEFILHSGYNEWAEANKIIVLFPQVKKSQSNPAGCWDWWGYTGPDYYRKTGVQPQALQQMIQNLIEKGSLN